MLVFDEFKNVYQLKDIADAVTYILYYQSAVKQTRFCTYEL